MSVGLVIRAAKAGYNLRAAVFHTGILIGAGQHVEAHFLSLRSYPISPKTAVLSKGAFCHFGKELRHQLIQARYPHCPSDFCTNARCPLFIISVQKSRRFLPGDSVARHGVKGGDGRIDAFPRMHIHLFRLVVVFIHDFRIMPPCISYDRVCLFHAIVSFHCRYRSGQVSFV